MNEVTVTTRDGERVLVLDQTEFDYLYAITARSSHEDYQGTAKQRLARKVREAL